MRLRDGVNWRLDPFPIRFLGHLAIPCLLPRVFLLPVADSTRRLAGNGSDSIRPTMAPKETAYSSHGGSRSRRGGLFDQFSEPESLVEFAHQDQAAVGCGPGTLEIDLQGSMEGKDGKCRAEARRYGENRTSPES